MLEIQFHLTELRALEVGMGPGGALQWPHPKMRNWISGTQGFSAPGEEGTKGYPGDISNFCAAKIPFRQFLQLLTYPRMKKTIGASSPGWEKTTQLLCPLQGYLRQQPVELHWVVHMVRDHLQNTAALIILAPVPDIWHFTFSLNAISFYSHIVPFQNLSFLPTLIF